MSIEKGIEDKFWIFHNNHLFFPSLMLIFITFSLILISMGTKKNITITLSNDEIDDLEAIKGEFGLSSYTKVIQHIKQFYDRYHDQVEQYLDSEIPMNDRVESLEEKLQAVIVKDVQFSQDLEYVKKHLDLIISNNEMMKPVLESVLRIQDSSVKTTEINQIHYRIEHLESLLKETVVHERTQKQRAMSENAEIKALLKAKKELITE